LGSFRKEGAGVEDSQIGRNMGEKQLSLNGIVQIIPLPPPHPCSLSPDPVQINKSAFRHFIIVLRLSALSLSIELETC
jgi:hypothetical protein